MARDALLSSVAGALLRYLQETLSQHREGTDWWKSHVVNSLSVAQTAQVKARNLTQLAQLDLAALLRVFQRNHGELSYWTKLPPDAMTLSHIIGSMRNAQAHASSGGDERSPEDAWREADAALRFLSAIAANAGEIAFAAEAREQAIQRAFLARALPVTLGPAPAAGPCSKPTSPPAADPAEHPTAWPTACTIGPFTIHGPGTLSTSEVQTFEGKSAAATTVPWIARGLGAELTIHLSILDDPEEGKESGMVMCVSRNASPQKWDDLVNRLRIGIRSLPNSLMQMDLRTTVARPGHRPTRSVVTIEDLSRVTGIDVPTALKRVGAISAGTREALTGDASRNREWPCVLFPKDTLLPSVVGWLLTTAMVIDKPASTFR